MGWVKASLQDHPHRITAVLLVLVVAHAVLTATTSMPFIWEGLLAQQPSDVVAVYLGLASIAAIISGFAGVVVVFGLSSPSAVFRNYRRQTGQALVANWTTPTFESMVAAVLALSSSLTFFAGLEILSAWVFEVALILLLHSGARLMWLLHTLMRVVKVDDAAAAVKASEPSLDDVFKGTS